MHILLFTYITLSVTSCGAVGLSSKLDFGDDSGASLIRTQQRSIPIRIDHVEIKKDKLDIIGKQDVKCSTTGCNTTKSKENNEVINTDVVVHVKTSVDVNNKTKEHEDVPDVPVVLGTNGVGVRNLNTNFQRGLQYQPASSQYGGNSFPLVVTNIEDAFPSLTSTLVPASLVQKHEGVDIKIKTLPPVMISMVDGYEYKTNQGGLEVKIPYFEPSYHNHYYGENSPSQVMFHPMKKSGYNPVAFNVPRPAYSFSPWNSNKLPVLSQNPHHPTNCMCTNNQNVHGLRWYPSNSNPVTHNQKGVESRNRGRYDDPGAQINDKLAPLN
ncbi:hypothetical protein HHI36_023538 [Cryptolaemus montrouzieri]|uniref:Uncharacterized protein n=1 Tax=Cryptolaemus montrouzieri TaxID=559131 RepID=A0ABD2PHA1_9CUCU